MWLIIITMLALVGYVAWHVWAVVPLPVWGKWGAVGLYAFCLAATFLMATRRIDRLPMGLARAVYGVGSTTIIVSAYLLLLCLVADVLRAVHVLPREWVTDSWGCTALVAVAMTGLLLYGNWHYRDKQRVGVALDSGGRLERPVRIVAASDLHIGYHNRRSELARWVDMINSEHPDMVLLAGDLIDGSMRPLHAEGMADELRRIEAPVFACLGNHEYYAMLGSGVHEVEQFFAEAGVTLLRDSVVRCCGVAIVGRDDRSNPGRASLQQLCSEVEAGEYVLVLDHQPYHLEEAEQAGVAFQVSGHTHRGQFWPASWVADWVYECSWGRHRRGGTDYYVSSGLGIWGPKYRIGTQSEYLVADVN